MLSTRLFLCLISLIATILTGCYRETVESSFPTAADALGSPAAANGWIPPWLPEDAVDIHEVHDLDSNEGALVAKLPNESKFAPDACRHANGGQFMAPAFSRKWLPSALDHFAFYACDAPEADTSVAVPGNPPMIHALAISPGRDVIVYWRNLSK